MTITIFIQITIIATTKTTSLYPCNLALFIIFSNFSFLFIKTPLSKLLLLLLLLLFLLKAAVSAPNNNNCNYYYYYYYYYYFNNIRRQITKTTIIIIITSQILIAAYIYIYIYIYITTTTTTISKPNDPSLKIFSLSIISFELLLKLTGFNKLLLLLLSSKISR